jgi:hypothetical protein
VKGNKGHLLLRIARICWGRRWWWHTVLLALINRKASARRSKDAAVILWVANISYLADILALFKS